MRHRQISALLLALALLLAGCSPAVGEGSPTPTPPGTVSVSPDVSPALPPESSPEPSPAGTDAPPAETASPSAPPADPDPSRPVGDIWLYGELHGEKNILEEELRLWREAYDRGARHLFVELPCFTAEFLNLWMAAEDDAIFDRLYADWAGTQAHNENVKAFYQSIKADCPETVFHGTDVGHQYDTTGERYLAYLRENGQEDTEQYRLAQTCVMQGRKYYSASSVEYRERMMTENFIRALEGLDGEEVMGFYGGAHIEQGPFRYDGQTVETSMAQRLEEEYGEKLHLMDLSHFATPDLEPERVDTIRVGDKDYTASYFGKVDISAWSSYRCREFWRLEGAYDDFRDAPATGQVLPYNNYPTRLAEGQVFAIDYTRPDGTVERKFYRSDGGTWNALPTTVEVLPPE